MVHLAVVPPPPIPICAQQTWVAELQVDAPHAMPPLLEPELPPDERPPELDAPDDPDAPEDVDAPDDDAPEEPEAPDDPDAPDDPELPPEVDPEVPLLEPVLAPDDPEPLLAVASSDASA